MSEHLLSAPTASTPTEPQPSTHSSAPVARTAPTAATVPVSRTARSARAGRAILAGVAMVTVVVPLLLDGIVLAGAHMQNPAWLPHAKLHAAISFLAAVALGGGALVCLLARPVADRFAMAMGGYLAGAFWIALIAAGWWPGTSYYFLGDPVYGTSIDDARILGVPNNVVTALVMLLAVVVGLALVLSAGRSHRGRAPR